MFLSDPETDIKSIYLTHGYSAAYTTWQEWDANLPKTTGQTPNAAHLWDCSDRIAKWLRRQRRDYTGQSSRNEMCADRV